MSVSNKVLVQELGSIMAEVNLLAQEVLHIATRMKALERWQTTMDTILKNMQDNN